MGGVGSGRYHRFGVKHTAEEFLWIDAQEWLNKGMLYDGGLNVHWGWPDQTGLRGTMMDITVLNGNRVLLRYAIPNGREQPTAFTQQIQLESTRCFFGGERWWFRCPQDTCKRRARRLYRACRPARCPPSCRFRRCRNPSARGKSGRATSGNSRRA